MAALVIPDVIIRHCLTPKLRVASACRQPSPLHPILTSKPFRVLTFSAKPRWQSLQPERTNAAAFTDALQDFRKSSIVSSSWDPSTSCCGSSPRIEGPQPNITMARRPIPSTSIVQRAKLEWFPGVGQDHAADFAVSRLCCSSNCAELT